MQNRVSNEPDVLPSLLKMASVLSQWAKLERFTSAPRDRVKALEKVPGDLAEE